MPEPPGGIPTISRTPNDNFKFSSAIDISSEFDREAGAAIDKFFGSCSW